MRELEVWLAWDPPVRVGAVAEDGRGRVFVELDPAFVRAGVELSPVRMPLRDGLFEHTVRPGVPLPGVFDDSRPDGWGLRLIHRMFQQAGRPASAVSPLEELAWLGERTMGALTYRPPTGPRGDLHEAVDLGALAASARQIDAGSAERVLPALLRAGGSPGGARPKVLVGFGPEDRCALGDGALPDGWTHWLVKLPRGHDDPDVVRREAVWMAMARDAGLEVPAVRVLDLGAAGDAFAVARFDRGPGRAHVLSAAGALDLDFRHATVDYAELGRLCARLCGGDLRQVTALFRRAVFNVAAVNEDDHLKNLAWRRVQGGPWELTPAYDLTWSPHPSGFRSTPVCGVDREVGRDALLELGERLGVPRASAVLDEVLAAVSPAPEQLTAAGCRTEVSAAAGRSVATAVARLTA